MGYPALCQGPFYFVLTFEDLHLFNPDPVPDPSFHFDLDPDPTFPFYVDPDPTYHYNAEPEPNPASHKSR
jgi:hypothetical protein